MSDFLSVHAGKEFPCKHEAYELAEIAFSFNLEEPLSKLQGYMPGEFFNYPASKGCQYCEHERAGGRPCARAI